MTVMVFAAHPDDEVIGPGATIAKYAQTEDVIVVIFSQGDSQFWAKLMEPQKDISVVETIKTRIKETDKACNILGVEKVIFLRLKDLNIAKQIRTRKVEKKIKAIIDEYHPNKILFHSHKDGHPDHIAVNKLLTKIIFNLNYKPKIMTYQVSTWNFLTTSHNQHFVDVSNTFHLKIKALEKYKSQKKLMNLIKKMTILKGLFAGKKIGVNYAETFFEV